jgi:hypothetical protein
MKTKEEIYQLGLDSCDTWGEHCAFVEGYTQCQNDMVELLKEEIRRAFIASNSDYQLMAADYSQIELRIIAALSKDNNMIEAFSSGQYIHKATAAKVFNVSLEEVTRDQRSAAKAVNFGILSSSGKYSIDFTYKFALGKVSGSKISLTFRYMNVTNLFFFHKFKITNGLFKYY